MPADMKDDVRRPQSGSTRRCSGFTLTELLVTLAILLAVLILVLPNVTGVTMQANENAAMSSLQSIYQAQVSYAARYPTVGFTCSLAALGGPKHGGAASASQARLLPPELASGRKSGYVFAITDCAHGKSGMPDEVTGFRLTAVPETPGHTGHFGYCLDQTDSMRMDPDGGTECTRNVD